MKTKTLTNRNAPACLPLALSGLLLVAASAQAQPANGSGPLPHAPNRSAKGRPAAAGQRHCVTETGPNFRVWTAAASNSQSSAVSPASASTNQLDAKWRSQGHRIVELATGMNYWNGQQWAPSDPSLVEAGDAFVASKVQHKVNLAAANLNTVGAVTVITPDGITLRSTPVAIGLYDAASGRAAIIAGITNCAGTLVNSNQVVYANAFAGSGVCADIIYHLERGSFQQDVVITGRLDPQDYGFPTNTTRIQILTEFYGAPEPDRIQHPVRVEQDQAVRSRMATPDLVDQVLGFGEFVLGAGRAVTAAPTSGPAGTGAPVVKEFKTISGRTFLIESVEYGAIRNELLTLPQCSVKTAFVPGTPAQAGLAYAAIPKPPEPGRTVAAQRTPVQTAKAAAGKSVGLVIDYIATLGGSLYGNTVFQGDTTYFVSGAVYCNGPTTIEGGAVFKYPHAATNACLYLNNTVTCATSAYCPAIFTAGDDFNVGEVLDNSIWPDYSGLIQGYYANPALDVYYVNNTTLSNLRFNHAQEAVRFECYPYTGYSETLADSQLIDCLRGIEITGLGSGIGTPGPGTGPTYLAVNNTLLGRIQYPLTASSDSSWGLYHCTADQGACLVTSSTASSRFSFVNSVFANVTTLSSGNATLGGNYNGFFSAPQFGANATSDTQSPFAPTQDAYGNPIVPSYFGAYYLRDGSPFINAGTPNISTSLKNDLAQRTTTPAEMFSDDVNSSMTLSPQPIRDTDTPDLGYHYPAVDYIVIAATVNNATLTIDQGTVLAGTSPYGNNAWPGYVPDWGVRLNPGGRLIVNGVPTNRVVFARLEAVQENPGSGWQFLGPLISWKGVIFPSGFAQPLPEARFHYADFPVLNEYGNEQFGNLHADSTYDLVANLEFDGCHFQNGWVEYKAGGPSGRTVGLTNNVFERTWLAISDPGDVNGTAEEQLTVANNLFYNCTMWLSPCAAGQGANWTFIDNIFDHVSFNDYDQWGNLVGTYNGPVGNNHHNAYIGMSTFLRPENQPATDPKLTSLSYASSVLGRFYLPSSATALIDSGSRNAGAAGLYHFTTQTSNAKEAASQVDIGPHYLALMSGRPADSNGDGIPDFIADRNGDGIEGTDEIPWQSQNNGSLAILSPLANSTISGIVPVRFALGADATNVSTIDVLIDGESQLGTTEVLNPAASLTDLEIDTTYLTGGSHTLSVQASYSFPSDGSGIIGSSTVQSPQISITVLNHVSYPNWQDQADLSVKLNAQIPASSAYSLWFFNSSYAKTQVPSVISNVVAGATDGNVAYSETPANLGYADPDSDPDVYSFIEYTPTSGSSAVRVNRNTQRNSTFPTLGLWTTSYEEDPAEYWWDWTNKVYRAVVDTNDIAGHPWFHQVQLGNWLGTATYSAEGYSPIYMPPGGASQTWPIRDTQGNHVRNKDKKLLLAYLANINSRNFYGCGHGIAWGPNMYGFMNMTISELKRKLKHHRYRFVFLDGCNGSDKKLLSAFGADSSTDLKPCWSPSCGLHDSDYAASGLRPGAFVGWSSEIPATRADISGTQRNIPEVCCEDGQLAWQWVYGNFNSPRMIQDAIDHAKQDVRAQFGQNVSVFWGGGVWTPDQLVLSGDGDLYPRSYNHAADWQ